MNAVDVQNRYIDSKTAEETRRELYDGIMVLRLCSIVFATMKLKVAKSLEFENEFL